jgi:hypothetical protein
MNFGVIEEWTVAKNSFGKYVHSRIEYILPRLFVSVNVILIIMPSEIKDDSVLYGCSCHLGASEATTSIRHLARVAYEASTCCRSDF